MTDPVSFTDVASEPLPPTVLSLWRVGGLIPAGVVVVVAAVIGLALGEALVLGGGLAFAALLAVLGWWLAGLYFRAWRWGLDDRWIETRHGVIVQSGQIVPRSRVQTLTTRTGPLDRWLGLTTVVIHTAGTHTPNLAVPHIDAEAVARLQQELGG